MISLALLCAHFTHILICRSITVCVNHVTEFKVLYKTKSFVKTQWNCFQLLLRLCICSSQCGVKNRPVSVIHSHCVTPTVDIKQLILKANSFLRLYQLFVISTCWPFLFRLFPTHIFCCPFVISQRCYLIFSSKNILLTSFHTC